MSPTPINKAAWLVAPKTPLVVGPADYTHPDAKQIVVKNAAIAVNPLDWAKQHVGDKKWEWITHPFVIGQDIAGEVVEIGPEVTRFKVGDRVIAHAVGFYLYGNRAAEGGFQHYTIAREHMASPIPDDLSFERACVIPMCFSAASCALYQKGYLALDYPTVPAQPVNGQYILITGGSTAVGSNAIQLAKFSGYTVVTTCSEKNFVYAKNLGADFVFDYNSPTHEDDIAAVLQGKKVAGAFAVGPGSVELSIHVLGQLGDECRKFIVKASFPWPKDDPKDDDEYWAYMKWVDEWNQGISAMADEVGIETKYVEGAELGRNEVSQAVYVNFLPAALGQGLYVAAPEPQVVGNGLESIQKALEIQKKGVSAKKVVVSLEE
ncbi:Zinc-binding oxidoreductase [Penicillium tannophilum]|nr:Zinc-binding oxidoreductase [Penicillium tannophilum]